MGAVPAGARVYMACVVLAALGCLATVPDAHTGWGAVALLAALSAGCDHAPAPRGPRAAGSPGADTPRGMGTFLPVLLAGAFLLPPAAAALVALPGALLAPVDQRPRTARRVWRAAQLAVAVRAASEAHGALGGPQAVAAAHFPLRAGPGRRRGPRLLRRARRPRRRHPRARRTGPAARRLARPLRPLAGPRRRARAGRTDDGRALAQSLRPRGRPARAAAHVRVLLGLRPVPPGTRRPPGHHPRPRPGRRHQGRLHPRSQRAGRPGVHDDRPRARHGRRARGGTAVRRHPARRRQARRPHPAAPQGRTADPRGTPDHRAASRVRARDGPRDRVPRRGPVGDPAPPRAAGRQRIPVRADRRADPGVRPGGGRRRRLRRDDLHPVLPPGPARCPPPSRSSGGAREPSSTRGWSPRWPGRSTGTAGIPP